MQLGQVIGEGEFGSVFEGRYELEDGEVRKIAVKVLQNPDSSVDGSGSAAADEFTREAEVMMKLDHQCVVQMIGKSISTRSS